MPKSTKEKQEEFKISGEDVKKKIKELIKEGNVRRIIVKNDKDQVVVEFPLTVGVAGILLAPMLAAIGALTALLTKCTIVVIRK
jgi:DNA-binding Lrp family transcriptional regulator